MDRKSALKQLKKLAMQQHEILNALAQDASEPAPQHLEPAAPAHGTEQALVWSALPDTTKATIQRLEVPAGGDVVKVQFILGKATQVAYDSVKNTVQMLQNQNKLTGRSYRIEVK